jgi:phospholipid/cholesterol/gamma-HCH transport system substrate-binding protein
VLALTTNPFARQMVVYANFSDVTGIGPGTPVLVAGVKEGKVAGLTINGSKVRATLSLSDGVQLPADSSAQIEEETLLGTEAVLLDAGTNWSRLLESGDSVPGTSDVTTIIQLQGEAVPVLTGLDARSLNSLIRDLAEITAGKAAAVDQLISGLTSLSQAVDSRASEVTGLIAQANQLAATVATHRRQLVTVLDNLQQLMVTVAAHQGQLGQLLEEVQSVSETAESVLGPHEAQVNAILGQLHSDLAIVGQHQVDLAQAIAYLSVAIEGFSSIGYSGVDNYPNSWANIFADGLGPVGIDALLGCNGVINQALNQILGPDPKGCPSATSYASGSGPVADSAPVQEVVSALVKEH